MLYRGRAVHNDDEVNDNGKEHGAISNHSGLNNTFDEDVQQGMSNDARSSNDTTLATKRLSLMSFIKSNNRHNDVTIDEEMQTVKDDDD